MSERLVSLGQIVTTHGIAGWLKVNCYNFDSTVLSSARQVYLERREIRSAHEIEQSKPYKGHFLVKLRRINSIAEAQPWVGCVLSVREDTLPSLKSGEYYHYQAIGLEVVDVNGERIGVVSQILSTPGGELYVVKGAKKEHLIPAVREIVEKVDFSAGKIIVNSPEGLLDL